MMGKFWLGLAMLAVLGDGAGRVAAQEAPSKVPFVKKHIYDEEVDPRKVIAAAEKQALREHKRILLDFGGDWCPDCQVLDIYFHQPQNLPLLEKNYILVHVFIGHMDKNLDLALQYGVPINKGVPALAVIDGHGKVIYAQATGQFNNMRAMDTSSVTEFLDKWKS
jgi:thiol:disulfide interchange protein